MEQSLSVSRRSVLRALGVGAGIAGGAGCTTPSLDPRQEDTPNIQEEGARPEDAEGPEDIDREQWTGVEEIQVAGYMDGWEGVEPEMIAGAVNPPIVLADGSEYTFSFENADGEPHSLELHAERDDVVHSTAVVEETGSGETLDFEATSDLEWYVCGVHNQVMVGQIEFLD